MAHGDGTSITFSERALSRLLTLVAALTGSCRATLVDTAETLLHHPAAGATTDDDQSDLCANGSPVQALLSAHEDRWVARLIADPAFDRADAVARLAASRVAIARVLALGGAVALAPLVAALLTHLVPDDEGAQRRYPTGMVRLGAALGAPGVAVYAGPDPGGDAWDAARRWAIATFARPADAIRLIDTLSRDCSLLGVGIEGVRPEGARAKIYWRMETEASLRSFGIPLFEAPSVLAFLGDIIGDRRLPLGALNFSAGFSPETGLLSDVKVDVARHDLGAPDALALVNVQAGRVGLSPPPLRGLLDLMSEHGIRTACVGLGLDVRGKHRINTYLHQS